MISDWSLYHLSPPRKLSASRSLTSSSERSSSGRSGQRGWSSPTKAAHWKREKIVEHIFTKMLNNFSHVSWFHTPLFNSVMMYSKCRASYKDSRIVKMDFFPLVNLKYLTLQLLCELKSHTINSIQLLMVGSTDIKSFSTGQALQNRECSIHKNLLSL